MCACSNNLHASGYAHCSLTGGREERAYSHICPYNNTHIYACSNSNRGYNRQEVPYICAWRKENGGRGEEDSGCAREGRRGAPSSPYNYFRQFCGMNRTSCSYAHRHNFIAPTMFCQIDCCLHGVPPYSSSVPFRPYLIYTNL